jgi:hypothetical protein
MKRVISAILVIAAFSTSAIAKYSGGSGDPNTPYQIATAADLNDIGNHLEDFNKCFIMIADINLAQYTGTQFKIIGPNSTTPFQGVFDGNGLSISNFTYLSLADSSFIGIFGYVTGEAQIMNLHLADPNVLIKKDYGAALVGLLYSGTINSCYITGAKVSGSYYIGGLVGRIEGGYISNCSSTGDISGWDYVGGLTGGIVLATIIDCWTSGNVSAFYGPAGGLAGLNYRSDIIRTFSAAEVIGAEEIGGLVGRNGNNTRIIECYSTGDVNGHSNAGGLIGAFWCDSPENSLVTDSYSTSEVSGNDSVGGLIGSYKSRITYSLISNSYAAGQVSGDSNVGGLVGYNRDGSINNSYFLTTSGPNNGYGTPLTHSQMKQQASFIGWDFVWETANGPNDVWAICEDVNYPKLSWQFVVGDSDSDKNVDFIDFAPFGNKWMQTDSTLYCGGSDLTGDGFVDLYDLDAFVENWLVGIL